MTQLSIVIPTLGRPDLLRRVLDRIDRQTASVDSFEVVVVADAAEGRLDELDAAAAGRRYHARRLRSTRRGASAARNTGWRQASSPVVLFVDDDILPETRLVDEHLALHATHPEPEVGVLGHVRWADELEVTPFMRWLEHGIQFNYPAIEGVEASWGHLYTANASVKKEMLERVEGFREAVLPFGYEDLDLGLRMHRRGFRLLYNRDAVAEHLHAMDLEFWKRRVARIAVSERQFVHLHPDFEPYFHNLLASAAAAAPAKGRGERLARFVPRGVPILGPWVWRSADAVYRQALAGPFMDAWDSAGSTHDQESVSGGPK